MPGGPEIADSRRRHFNWRWGNVGGGAHVSRPLGGCPFRARAPGEVEPFVAQGRQRDPRWRIREQLFVEGSRFRLLECFRQLFRQRCFGRVGPGAGHELVLRDRLGELVSCFQTARLTEEPRAGLEGILGGFLGNLFVELERPIHVGDGDVAVIGQVAHGRGVILVGRMQERAH